MQIPRRKSEELKKRDTGPIYLTENGFKLLKEKLEHLKRVLPERIAETARTAAFGDRSDNAEYKTAKGILRRTNYQIIEIQEQLKRVVVIKKNQNNSDQVQLGSTVVVEKDGQRYTYQIIGPQETDPTKGLISYQSPLGMALMNHKKGDIIAIRLPANKNEGAKEYRILEIR